MYMCVCLYLYTLYSIYSIYINININMKKCLVVFNEIYITLLYIHTYIYIYIYIKRNAEKSDRIELLQNY